MQGRIEQQLCVCCDRNVVGELIAVEGLKRALIWQAWDGGIIPYKFDLFVRGLYHINLS